MIRSVLAFLGAVIIMAFISLSFANTKVPENAGFFARVGHSIGVAFSKLGHFFGNPDTDTIIVEPKEKKDGAKLMRSEAKVSEKLHLQYAGPRNDEKPRKESVDLDEVQNQTNPLPKPEEPSINNDKNLPVRKKIALKAELDRVKNEKADVDVIDKKVLNQMPPVPLATTVTAEVAASEVENMDKLEADFASGNPPKDSKAPKAALQNGRLK